MITPTNCCTYSEIHRRNPEVLPENGYSKAIDIWSLGCISFVLLSGEQAFVNHGDPLFKNDPLEVIMKLASQCDLSMIDNSRAWNHVSKRAKGFVKDVLVLDESRRLDAKQALRHPWFTNPRCAREFHEVYQHCIRDWKPRGKVFKLVERLAVSDRLSSNQNRSRYFTSAPRLDPSPHSEGLNRSSPTLPSIAEEPLTEQAVASMGLPRMSFGPSSLVSQFSMPKEDLMETMSQLTISQFNMMGTQHSARLSDHSRRTEDLADVKGSMDISIPNHGGDFDVDFHDMVAPYSMSLDMKECVQETPPRFPANCSFPNSQTA